MVLATLQPHLPFPDHCQLLVASARHRETPSTHLAIKLGVLVEGVVELQGTLLQSHREDGLLPRTGGLHSKILLFKQ